MNRNQIGFSIIDAVRGLYSNPDMKIRRKSWESDVFLCIEDILCPPMLVKGSESSVYSPTRDDYLYLDWEGMEFNKCMDKNIYRAMMHLFALGGVVRRSDWSPWTYVDTLSFFDNVPTIHYLVAGVQHQELFIPSKADYLSPKWEARNGKPD